MCTSDFDCQGRTSTAARSSTVTGICGPSRSRGTRRRTRGTVDTVTQADDIGYPTLLVDNGNGMPNSPMFYLGVWKHTGTVTNIELHRFNENPSLGGASADLAGILPGAYEQFGSSPGMAVSGLLGGRLRLLFAGDPPGRPRWGCTESTSRGNLQGFATSAAAQGRSRRRRLRHQAAGPRAPADCDNWGMWVQGNKLFFFDGQVAATPVYTGKRVVGSRPSSESAVPMRSSKPSPWEIRLARPPSSGPTAAHRCSLWWATRAGRAAARPRPTTPRAVAERSRVVERGPAGPSLKTNFAGCLGAFCQAAGADTIPNSDDIPAAFPELASAKVPGRDTDRDFAESFQVTFARPEESSRAATVLIGSMTRVEVIGDAGAAPDAGPPPRRRKSTPHLPHHHLGRADQRRTGRNHRPHVDRHDRQRPRHGGLGRARNGAQTHVLKTRRFLVKACN